MPKKCKTCNNSLYGRSDKLFCCVSCKTYYHRSAKSFAEKVLRSTAKALIRNRTILLELMKSNNKEITVDRSELDSKKFNWHIMTGTHVNAKGKTLHYNLDFAWMIFSNQKILIRRVNKSSIDEFQILNMKKSSLQSNI